MGCKTRHAPSADLRMGCLVNDMAFKPGAPLEEVGVGLVVDAGRCDRSAPGAIR
jgi:hypothetical protein